MAAITTAASGDSNVAATWTGGVIPVEGDTVTVAAAHTLTIKGAHVWGADTATAALTINGTVQFDTAANTDLRLKGDLSLNTSTGRWIRNIPTATVTSKVRVNYSATPANLKYDGKIGQTGRFQEWTEIGAARTRLTTLTADLAVGATSATVAAATGWRVGDIIVIESTTATNTQIEHRVLTSVSGTTVGWTAALTSAHASGANVGNASSNVMWESDAAGFYGRLRIGLNASQPANSITIQNVAFHGLGGNNDTGGLDLGGSTFFASGSPWGTISGLACTNIRADGTDQTGYASLLSFRNCTTPPTVSGSLLAFRTGQRNTALAQASGGTGFFTNGLILNATTGVQSFFSQGGVGCQVNGTIISGCDAAINGAPSIALKFSGGSIDRCTYLTAQNAGDLTLTGTSIGVTTGFADTRPFRHNNAAGMSITLVDCALQAGTLVNTATLPNTLAASRITVTNRGGDTTAQEEWTNTGGWVRDNTTLLRSRSSLKGLPIVANGVHSKTFAIAAQAGVALTLRLGLRFDATYGTATPPSVSLSGLGGTTQTFTCPATADTWFEQSLTITPTTTGNLMLTVTGQSTATSGQFWVSGVPIAPWIDWAFHYGFVYNPSSAAQTVDGNLVANFSTASAYTGLAWAGSVLTVTVDHSPEEIYDWAMAYAVANRLAPFVSGTPAALVIAGGLALTNARITGSGGTITATSYTPTGTGDTDQVVVVGATRKVKLRIPGLDNGSRVYLRDLTNGVDLPTISVSGGGVVLPRDYTADTTFRYRIAKRERLRVEGTIVLGSMGATALVTQVADSVHATFVTSEGGDGSTVSEFSADLANIQTDVNDATNDTTTERLYLWLKYLEESDNGILTYFGALEAEDAGNIRINRAVSSFTVQNLKAATLVWRGARLYTSDGSSWIAPGTGSIEPQFGKVYTVAGSGGTAPSAATVASAVRSELTTELARLDVAVSTRNATTPPTTAQIRTELATELARLDVAVSSRNATTPPTAAAVATATRTELATELARIDAAVSSCADPTEVRAAVQLALGDYGAAASVELATLPTASDIAAAIGGRTVLAGWSYDRLLRVLGALAAAKTSGMVTGQAGTAIIRDLDDSRDLLTATLDAHGNRSSVTVAPP